MNTASFSQTDIFQMLQTLVLASSSPRRRELLCSIGLTFEVFPSGTEEDTHPEKDPDALVKCWAEAKARAVSGDFPSAWVLAADTIVVVEDAIFGKPRDKAEAAFMLRTLSGRWHQVMSGICLMHHNRGFVRVGSIETEVGFKTLSEAEIRAYVQSGEPLDKAGAYGIQGMGAFLVEAIRGSYTNVVGLPLCEVVEWLLEQRIIAPNI